MKQLLTQIGALFLLLLNLPRLGPIQRKWIFSLIIHPKRQITGKLGEKEGNSYQACCLGEAGLIAKVCYWAKSGTLYTSSDESMNYLRGVYEAIGLYGEQGKHKHDTSDSTSDDCLAYFNDKGKTWPQIALIILNDVRGYLKEKK